MENPYLDLEYKARLAVLRAVPGTESMAVAWKALRALEACDYPHCEAPCERRCDQVALEAKDG